MILNASGQKTHSKLIGKTESDTQHQIRCYMKTEKGKIVHFERKEKRKLN